MVVIELKALAKKMNVALPSRAKKADIVDVLLNASKITKEAPSKKAAPKNNHTSALKKRPAKKETTKPVEPKRAPIVKKPAAPAGEWKFPPTIEEPLLAQERVADAKYYTGPAQDDRAKKQYEDLPSGYGEDKITLMIKDPHLVYTYWELSSERIQREKTWFGWDSKLTVRIYDVTGVQFDGRNAVGYFDQEVMERIGSWYFDVGRPSHSFVSDIGLLSPEGKYLTLSRSNYIITPREGVSHELDDEWMLGDEEFWKMYGFPGGVSSAQIQEMIRLRRMQQQITSPGVSVRERAKRK